MDRKPNLGPCNSSQEPALPLIYQGRYHDGPYSQPPTPVPHCSITYIYAMLTYCTNYSGKLIKFKSETPFAVFFQCIDL